jgi:hypothetical protein
MQRRLHPKEPYGSWSDIGGPVGSPASIHGLVVFLPSRMEFGAKGKEGQPHPRRAGLAKTVTCRVTSVIFCKSRRFDCRHPGKPQERTAFAQVDSCDTGPSSFRDQSVM